MAFWTDDSSAPGVSLQADMKRAFGPVCDLRWMNISIVPEGAIIICTGKRNIFGLGAGRARTAYLRDSADEAGWWSVVDPTLRKVRDGWGTLDHSRCRVLISKGGPPALSKNRCVSNCQ